MNSATGSYSGAVRHTNFIIGELSKPTLSYDAHNFSDIYIYISICNGQCHTAISNLVINAHDVLQYQTHCCSV